MERRLTNEQQQASNLISKVNGHLSIKLLGNNVSF